jgi:hypothetical protein
VSRWRRALFRARQRPSVEGVAAVSIDGGSWTGGGVYCKQGVRRRRRWRSRGVGVGSGVGRRWGKRFVWLLGGAHARFLMCREAPALPIPALNEGTGTGLPAIRLGSKISWHLLEHTCASPKSMPAPKTLSGPLWGVPVEML